MVNTGNGRNRFARIVAANTFLPTGDQRPGEAFLRWQKFSQETPNFNVGRIVNGGCVTELPKGSPPPTTRRSQTTPTKRARQFPLLVPTFPDDRTSAANRRAWSLRQAQIVGAGGTRPHIPESSAEAVL